MAKDLVAVARRALTPAQFGDLADVQPELEWLANPHPTPEPTGATIILEFRQVEKIRI